MLIFRRLAALWRNLARKNSVEQELDDEVRAYLELLVDEKLQDGMGPGEARRAALVEMGGVEQVKEGVREVRMGSELETFLQDLRYGARMLVKKPGFTFVAVLTLGLGIGAKSAFASLLAPMQSRSSS